MAGRTGRRRQRRIGLRRQRLCRPALRSCTASPGCRLAARSRRPRGNPGSAACRALCTAPAGRSQTGQHPWPCTRSPTCRCSGPRHPALDTSVPGSCCGWHTVECPSPLRPRAGPPSPTTDHRGARQRPRTLSGHGGEVGVSRADTSATAAPDEGWRGAGSISTRWRP